MFTDKWMTCIVIYVMYTSQLRRIAAYEYPSPCDFDHSLCQWQQLEDDDFDWTLQSGNTPSGSTGPSSDHTQGSSGSGQYVYIEASSNYGKTARLVSSPINPSLSDPCTMVFYYHMYGTNIGNLQILFTYEGETNETRVWYKAGNQGNSWNRGSVSFYNVTRPFQVIVQGETGNGYKSDIAMDDISFLDGCIRGDEGSLRLVNPVSGSQKEGRVEIFLQGQWGSICSFGTSWDLEREGKVVCRQLGYQSAEWTRSIYPAPDTTPILLDNVQCNGTEAALVDCSHEGYGVVDSRCTHLYDITLQCLEGCVDPGTPANGRQTGSPDYSHGSDVTFVCSSGYEIEGSSSISCNDGTWSAQIPFCSVVGSTHYPMGTSARPMIGTTHDPFGTSARPMVGSTHDQFGTSAQPMVETTHDPIGTSARLMLGTTPDFMWTSNPPEAGTSHDSIATSTEPIDMTTHDPIRVMTQPMPETTHDSNGTPTAPMIVSTQDQNVVRSPTPSETRNTEALHETTTQPVEESTKQSMRVMTSPIVGTTKNLIASTDSVSTRDERYVYTTPGRYDATTAVYDQPGSSRLRLSTEQTTRLPERVTTSESVTTDTTHIPDFAYSINLRIVNLTSRSATIAWQDQFQNGRQVEILDYQVRYTADGETQMLYSLSSHSTVILMDLRPGTQYMVSVTGNTVIGSNTSNEVQFVTDPEPPLWIDVIDFDSDSIQLWFQVGWSKYDFFRVSIQKKTGGDYVEIDATSPKVTLEQLVPETLYEISVKTVVNIGGNTFESSRSKTVVNSTALDYCASDPCPGSTTCISSSAGYFCNCPSGDAEQCWQKSDGKQENSVPMSFTLENAEYSEELADRTSPKFKQLEKDIIGEISQLYANNSDFERVEITEFRPGSIVVVMNIVLHDNATESAIESAVESATSHLSMNGILNYTTSNVTRQTDYCYGKPCQNDGICVSGSADYVCYCRDNYIGKRCEHEYIVLDRGSQTMWFLEEEKVINPIMEIRSLVRNPESVLEYGLKNTADSVFFKLDTKTGQLNTTLGSFDRESRESYQLGITLTGRASRSVLDINIHVEDINDNNPVFHNTPYYPKVMEYSPVGTLITTLTAADPDQNDDLNYSLSSDQDSLKYFSNLVSVESKTGRVILTGTLNRKLLKEDGYLVENENVAIPIAVSDGATSTRGTIFLDVVPLFVRPTVTSNETTRLRLSLPEDAAVGSFVADVRLPESNDVEYTYRIFKADNYNNFSFAVNETSGVVRTTQTLDREERDDYGFYVFALDNHCLTSTEVYIELRVEDVNDNAPEFPETSYSAEIREDATSAQTVFVQPPIRATDKDIGTNAEIAFSLSGQGHEQFTIDPETGTVKTSENNNLDYETTKMYSLTLTARDMNGDAGGQWNSVPLIIYITDYNDNKPLFSHPNLSLQLSEATQPGTSITSINATDADEGLNAALLYFISEGSQGKFKVDLHTGELSVLGHLDRETTEFYDLEIIVRDQGLHVLDNAVHVLINVTDVNDNSPLFTELFYSAHVAENATKGFQVISVTASDADTGDNGRVTYALDSTQEFVIHPITGIVTTRLQLDREKVDSYNLVVTATDNSDDVRRSSNATLRIVIDDVNDNIPKFSKTEYTSTLFVGSSELSNGTIATIVSASDPDSGENGKIVYSVDDAEHSQTFSIDSSGVVRVNRDKPTNTERITFNITARNNVSPALFDRATVAIDLEHESKTFAFDVEHYVFKVTENVDADLGKVRVLNSSGITYKLAFDIPGINIIINSTSGVITLISPLDREINPQVIFNLFAESEYIAKGLAFTTVTITVEDVNDNPSYFEYPDELYHVVAGGLRENHLNDTFLTVQANDEDSGHNGQIQYSIIDGNEDAKFISTVTLVSSQSFQRSIERRWIITH